MKTLNPYWQNAWGKFVDNNEWGYATPQQQYNPITEETTPSWINKQYNPHPKPLVEEKEKSKIKKEYDPHKKTKKRLAEIPHEKRNSDLLKVFEKYNLGDKSMLCLWRNGYLSSALRERSRELELRTRLSEWLKFPK